MLKRYAKGPRLAIVSGDDETHRNTNKIHNTRFFGGKAKEVYLKTFADFKTQFLNLQENYDMIFFGAMAAIKDWNEKEAEEFLLKNTKIPTGARDTFMARFAVVTYAKQAEEQGEWAAQAALKILDGASPSSIPITQNKKIELFINSKLAKKVGIEFPKELVRIATVLK
jgi:ABC-type uncharacterized transport system substrate-binding protein